MEGVRGGRRSPGSYRTVQNYVANSRTREIIYTPPPPEEVAPLMRELVDWLRAETDIHPVLVAGIAQFQLVHIHPFLDGNGRTSRLLSTLCLYRAGYDFKRLFTLSEFYDRDRGAFYRALQSVRERDMDLTGWLELLRRRAWRSSWTRSRSAASAVIRADVLAQAAPANARQAAVLVEAIHEAGMHVASATRSRSFPEVSRRTPAAGP